jgi:ribosomal protein S27E
VAPYVPRAAADTVVHGVVQEHLETFLAAAAARTGGVGPRVIERELRAFLRCGLLVHGFLRVRCDDCAFERLVPLSCKGRAVCASCGGRRMAEQAANRGGARAGGGVTWTGVLLRNRIGTRFGSRRVID